MTDPNIQRLTPNTPRAFLARLLGALCLMLTAFHLFSQLPAATRVEGRDRDLAVYYAAAREARARHSPYTAPGAWTLSQTPSSYLYPPPFALALAPLGGLSPAAFYRLWYGVLEVALWVLCGALMIVADSREWLPRSGVHPHSENGIQGNPTEAPEVPEARLRIAQQFTAGSPRRNPPSPVGTTEEPVSAVPTALGLRARRVPGLEVLDYCQSCLRHSGANLLLNAAFLVGPLAYSSLLVVSFGMGQADLIVFAACAAAGALALRARPHAAGALLAAAACVKIYPALLLIPLARRFGWRPLGTAAAVGLAALAASWLWFGTGIFRDFLADALPIVSQGTVHRENMAPVAVIARLAAAAGALDPSLPSPAWLRAVGLCCTVLVLAAIGVVSWRLPFPAAYGWAAGLSILAGAICWTSYWTMWLILAAMVWREGLGPQCAHWRGYPSPGGRTFPRLDVAPSPGARRRGVPLPRCQGCQETLRRAGHALRRGRARGGGSPVVRLNQRGNGTPHLRGTVPPDPFRASDCPDPSPQPLTSGDDAPDISAAPTERWPPFAVVVGTALALSIAADPLAFKGPLTAALVVGAVTLAARRGAGRPGTADPGNAA